MNYIILKFEMFQDFIKLFYEINEAQMLIMVEEFIDVKLLMIQFN